MIYNVVSMVFGLIISMLLGRDFNFFLEDEPH